MNELYNAQIKANVDLHLDTGPPTRGHGFHHNGSPVLEPRTWPYFVGAKVKATHKIWERNFAGSEVHTHATPGDIGTIVFIERGEGGGTDPDTGSKWEILTDHPTVRFHESGSATTVYSDQITFTLG